MPELPEVEVLVRHLAPRLLNKTIRAIQILDRRSLRQTTPAAFTEALTQARFQSLQRRGKHLVFTLRKHRHSTPLIAHLGMTGRLFLAGKQSSLPRHATIVLGLARENLVFEDVRRFGGMTLDTSAIERLGPEPLEPEFTVNTLSQALARSRQPIKIKLLDQSVVAGIGNIYASEALFRARLDPCTPSQLLSLPELQRLRSAIRRVLSQSIRFGSTMPLDFGGSASRNGLFYYGQSPEHAGNREERFQVYDREGKPCRRCKTPICKKVQAARSTYYCPRCQA